MNRLFVPLAVLLVCAAWAGCSTGVVPAGPNTYLVSTSQAGLISAGVPMAKAYREANAWCAARGLVMVPVSVQTADAVYGEHMAHCDLIFKALRPGSPEIGRTAVARTHQAERPVVHAPTIYEAPRSQPVAMPGGRTYRVRDSGLGTVTVTPTGY